MLVTQEYAHAGNSAVRRQVPGVIGNRGRSFVLVHGAWHGGWCWKDVAEILRRRGHTVSTPTQTGLGERRHLLSESIDFDTYVEDLSNHLLFEDLQDVVLVGHSFGASVVAAAADSLRDRIGQLIFLDGFLPEPGRSAMEQKPDEVVRQRTRAAQESSGGLTMPVPDAKAFGIKNERQLQQINRKLTPHPLRTYLTKIQLSAPLGNGLPCDYVVCTEPRYPGTDWSILAAQRLGWPVHALSCGHDAMIEAPVPTADLLEWIGTHTRAV
jgi:pimeloyl-ACP methyl ester carboxylesterase